MPETDPLESELAALKPTICAEPQTLSGLLPQLEFVSRLLAEASAFLAGPALVFRDRDGRVQVQPLGESLCFGRGADCQLSFPNLKEISRQHFTIVSTQLNDYQLVDEGSMNGTFIRGKPARATHYTLVDGDIIDAGGFSFVFIRN